jgi:hypothetical protein
VAKVEAGIRRRDMVATWAQKFASRHDMGVMERKFDKTKRMCYDFNGWKFEQRRRHYGHTEQSARRGVER